MCWIYRRIRCHKTQRKQVFQDSMKEWCNLSPHKIPHFFRYQESNLLNLLWPRSVVLFYRDKFWHMRGYYNWSTQHTTAKPQKQEGLWFYHVMWILRFSVFWNKNMETTIFVKLYLWPFYTFFCGTKAAGCHGLETINLKLCIIFDLLRLAR